MLSSFLILGLGGSSHLGYVVNSHGDRQSPKDRVVGPLPNGRTSWLTNGGDPNHLQVLDDPPSGCSLKWGPLKKKPVISHQIKESIGRYFFWACWLLRPFFVGLFDHLSHLSTVHPPE